MLWETYNGWGKPQNSGCGVKRLSNILLVWVLVLLGEILGSSGVWSCVEIERTGLRHGLTESFPVLVSRSGELMQACVRSDSLITTPSSLAWRLWWDTCTARCSGRFGWAGFWVFPARSCAGTPGWGSVHALYGLSRLTVRLGSTTPQRTSPQTPHAVEKKSIRTSLVLILALQTSMYWRSKCDKPIHS